MLYPPSLSLLKKLTPALGCLSLALVACQAPLPNTDPTAPLTVTVPLAPPAENKTAQANAPQKSQIPAVSSPVKTVVLPPELVQALPAQVASLKLQSERSSFTAVGQQSRLSLQLLDAQGHEVKTTATLQWSSSHPERISVASHDGLSATLSALSAAGPAEITVQLAGTELKASVKLAVVAPVTESSSSGGGGGGGGGSPSGSSNSGSGNANPTESLSSNLFFDGLGLGEFKINTYSIATQNEPQVAANGQGQFVVVWTSHNQDGSFRGVYAQRFNNQGLPLGSEFRVNTTTANDQFNPTVAMNSNGNFVVAWTSINQDGSNSGVYAQRYATDGTAQGGEFRVNVTTAGEQSNPSIGMDDTGRFVIAYNSQNLDGDDYGVEAVRFDAAGQVLGNFQVNTFTTGKQNIPTLGMNSNGQFVVAWNSTGQDGDSIGIYAQRYAADGSAVGAEFRANTYTSDIQSGASVAVGPDGRFNIVWSSNGQDGSNYGIYGQRYAADGSSLGSEFRANTITASYQDAPDVAVDNNGNFVVSWESNNQDGDNYGLFAQRYNSEGLAQGTEFQVNTITAGSQSASFLAMMANGGFVVVWEGNNIDGNGSGVAGKRFNAQGAAL